jgi:hypothetical protein
MGFVVKVLSWTGVDARPPSNYCYSMLEPRGWYLYLLPSQKTTDVI